MTYNNQFRRGPKPGNSRPNFRRAQPKRGAARQNINPALFVNKNVAHQTTEQYVARHTFADFALGSTIQRNIETLGYTSPSAIQDQTIPLVLEGKDVIGLANTGTGKTAAFLLPILEKLASKRTEQSVLIMAPTRELAQQIDQEFKKFSIGLKLYSAVLVGGVNINGQIRQLKRSPHIIIGTPGRLQDLLNQGILRTTNFSTLVLDEADRMLDMGFVNDIRRIVSQLSENRQTLCFSATMSNGIKEITRDFMKNPEIVSVKVTETNDHIYQDVIGYTDEDHKKELLLEMLQKAEFEKVIVFGQTKFGVQRLSDKLAKQGIQSEAIHGNKSQGQRNRALNSFKTNESNVLVATDVAARGLDIPNVSHVINFDLPVTYDDYVHRIGRTGRGGKSGTALTFVRHK